MRKPEHFELADGYARFAPQGKASLDKAIEIVGEAISYAREQEIRRLLIDITGLRGIRNPGTMDRYSFAKDFAEKSRSQVICALVAPAEMIDPERFGVVVARNHGFLTDVFTTEREALEWLLDPKAG